MLDQNSSDVLKLLFFLAFDILKSISFECQLLVRSIRCFFRWLKNSLLFVNKEILLKSSAKRSVKKRPDKLKCIKKSSEQKLIITKKRVSFLIDIDLSLSISQIYSNEILYDFEMKK